MIEQIAAALAETGPATSLRFSRWGYAAVNAGHILGIAMLVGSILPLDLRLFGFWRDVAVATLARVLIPTALFGLTLAIATGFALFSVRAPEYVTLRIFQVKLALIATGAVSAISVHTIFGMKFQHASERQMRTAGAISMICWLGALACGRLIGFIGG